MRPSEIDYSSRLKHYFDVSNGEVLAGKQELNEYVAQEDVNPEHILGLGALLRQNNDLPGENFDTVNPQEWSRERLIEYGRWLYCVVEPPANNKENRLNRDIITRARNLGLAPGYKTIKRIFGSAGQFYVDIEASDTDIRGKFDNWSIEDFVGYIKRTVGDRKPSRAILNQSRKGNPNNPGPKLIHERFQPIGGVRKLFELAGYQVTELWERDDYINWGVNVMQANDGLLPTTTMANYFSRKGHGPSGKAIIDNFNLISEYQKLVARQYYDKEQQDSEERTQKLFEVSKDISNGVIPSELFTSGGQRADFRAVVALLGENETILRYAKYKVVESVDPEIPIESKLIISKDGIPYRGFVAAIKKHSKNAISEGGVEYAALVLEVFDDIWPMDSHLETLKLDDEFHKYRRCIEEKRKTRINNATQSQKELVSEN